MSLRMKLGIYPFGPIGTQRVFLFLGSFCKLSQSTNLSDFPGSYQNLIRIVIWLFFLIVYSQAGTIFFSRARRSPKILGDRSIFYGSDIFARRCVNRVVERGCL
jgi:hypothetical protein